MLKATFQAVRPGLLVIFPLVVALAIAVPSAPSPVSAGGATIVVNTLADEDPIVENGECSLREAIVNANDNAQTHADCEAGAGDDTIIFDVTFPVAALITLDGPLPPITDPAGLTIDGGEEVIVNGASMTRLFVVESDGVLTLLNLNMSGGYAEDGGAGIFNSGTLTLNNSAVYESNAAGVDGGGIYNNEGTLMLIGSLVTLNLAGQRGGGIFINSGEVTLIDSTVSENRILAGNGNGAGIKIVGGELTLIDSVVTENEGIGSGAGIYNTATVTLSRSVVSENEAGPLGSGGGIFSSGTLVVADSTVTGNEPGLDGGGIFVSGGQATVTRSSVSGNDARFGGGVYAGPGADLSVLASTIAANGASDGGGVYNNAGAITVANSTISGNTAEGLVSTGGGIHNQPDSQVTLINTTITANDAGSGGGGIFNAGDATATNTIVADQNSGGDCAGAPLTSGGHNLDSDDTCGLTEDSDITNGDANLGPLADNGGPTLTHALLEGSDAIDAGDDAVCQDEPVNGVDQRGGFRPAGEACDIGAFEFGAVIPLWGDIDCDGAVVIGDALKTARYLLGLSVSQEPGCPEPGADVTADGIERIWGDVDCDESVAIGDALKIARWLLELSVSQEEGCPEIGTEVFTSS